MTKILPTQFYKEIREKLPQAIIDGILSYDTTLKIEEIGLKHRLQIDQIGILVDIVQDIGYGIVASKDFLEILKKELEMPSAELLPLVSDIDEQIFKPVKDEMLRTFQDGAPNKPRTISTLAEDDTHHETLSKKDILDEIENPHPVSVRKEIGAGEVKVNIPKPVTDSANVITKNPENKITPNTDQKPITDEIKRAREKILSSIGESKLSGITKMEVRETPKEVKSSELLVNNNATKQETKPEETKQTPPPKPETEPKTPPKIIDPYREALN